MLTLDEFKEEILAESVEKYTEVQVAALYEIAKRFSDFAFKKWDEERSEGLESTAMVDV